MIAALVAGMVFVLSLYLIFSEKLDRTITSMVGAATMVSAGLTLGFYSESQAIAAIDFKTLGLLLGTMLLVALLEPTGFFQFLALWAARISRGNLVHLLVLLGIVTTVLSMFLANVTTVVLIAPVTILISEVLGVRAVPFLIAEALLSNTGGVATLIGDPPNVLIASAADLTFNDFLTHALPVVVIVWLIALALLWYLFRDELSQRPLDTEAVLKLDPMEALEDRATAGRVLVVLLAAIALFLTEEQLHLTPAFIALSAAAAGLVWVRPDVRKTLERIEWNVLLFFGALFVMVGGLKAAGVLHGLAMLVTQIGHIMPPMLFGVLTLWIVAALSAVVDNVPITIALIPVIQELGSVGVDIRPLWWAVAFGAGFGGNGTIIGSTANIVVASLSERTRTPITPALWNRRGLPVMIATCLGASILYALFFPWFGQ